MTREHIEKVKEEDPNNRIDATTTSEGIYTLPHVLTCLSCPQSFFLLFFSVHNHLSLRRGMTTIRWRLFRALSVGICHVFLIYERKREREKIKGGIPLHNTAASCFIIIKEEEEEKKYRTKKKKKHKNEASPPSRVRRTKIAFAATWPLCAIWPKNGEKE